MKLVATKVVSVGSHGVSHGVSLVEVGASHVATDVKSFATHGASAVKSAATILATEAKKLNKFNSHKAHSEIPLRLNKNFTLMDTTISCHGHKKKIDAHIKVNIAAKIDMKLNFGYVIKGQLMPPKLDDVSSLLAFRKSVADIEYPGPDFL